MKKPPDANAPMDITLFSLADLSASTADAVTTIRTARMLAQDGSRVTVIAPRPKTSQLTIAASPASVLFHPNVTRVGLPNVLNSVIQVVRSFGHRSGRGKRVFFVRAGTFTFLFGLVRRLSGGPVVFSEHHGWFELERRMSGRHGWFSVCDRYLQMLDVRFADRVRTVVPGIRDLFVLHGAPHDKVAVIGNACDIDNVRPVARAAALAGQQLDASRRYIGYLGSLTVWQGLEEVIDAMAQVAKRRQDTDFLIVGDGPLAQALRGRAEQHGLATRVRFWGPCTQDEVSEILGCFDVAVLPTSDAGYAHIGRSPLKLREYAAAGKLILAARIPAIEDLADETWLTTYEPGDPDALARAFLDIVDDKERIEDCLDSARAYAEAEFSWPAITQRIRVELEMTVGGRSQ